MYCTLTYTRQPELRAWLCDTRDYRGGRLAALIYTGITRGAARSVKVVSNPNRFPMITIYPERGQRGTVD